MNNIKWSICLPSYSNFIEVYFTIQSLRLYHDLTDCEIVVVDNFGDPALAEFCKKNGAGIIRYEKYTDVTGVSAAKNRAIEIARGEFILCMDSHILLKPGTLDRTPQSDDLIQGPCLSNDLKMYGLSWRPGWRRQMWGMWNWIMSESNYAALNETEIARVQKINEKGDFRIAELPTEPFEIWATGAGFFCCRRDSWLGFNPDFRAFGGETGYIQEKYRKAGLKVWCDPSKIWVHLFCNGGRKIPFPCHMIDRVRNYLIGFAELGLDTSEMENHFGPLLIKQAREKMRKELYETATTEPEEVR
jgi:glycosyltransferase involved in cell wall biosynthesis